MKAVAITALLLCAVRSGDARVDRVEILNRADVLGGKAFGDAGAYEKVAGKVHFAIKPETAANKSIVDLAQAPRNSSGEVEFVSDFYILRPKEATRVSGSVLLEIPNRGGKGILAIMQGGKGSRDPSTEEEFGDGFLMRRGVTVAWLGWQWDVREDANMMRMQAPVAHEADGKPITGLVRADFVPNEKMPEYPLGHLISGSIGGTEYACSDLNDPANLLTVRDAPMAARRTIPRGGWQFTGDRRAIRLNGGFEPGKIYEVVYCAQDPVIAGVGLAAVRDFASYLKQPANELVAAQRVYALGISQSGRFLRHFLREGFNADEAGKRAIDGMFIHVAGGGIGSFNHRFAQPSRDAQPTTALFYPTDLFPFTDAPQTDPESGQTAGLLDRAKAGGVLPKIFYTNTSYEYWSRAASLIHTSPDGKRDVAPMENARIYLLAGLQHFSGQWPPVKDNERGLASANLPNPNPVRWFWRALFVAMDDWIRDDKEPPASRYPKIADGTLVRRDALKFPKIAGVELPQRVHEALRLDFGPQWKKRIITKQPPGVGRPFPALVPHVDQDGNDLGGVRLPELEVPLATYTGWNLRDPKTGMPNERVSFLGSFFTLPKIKADAGAAGDPREAIAERYPSREEYVGRFREAAKKLADDRFILCEDVDALVARGGDEWDYVTK
ncbi:MAG: alpha/beta hydrolase domain-containing protein [Chthoniobacterales bacterium]